LTRHIPLHGIIAYPITPFSSNGTVDLPQYRRLLERLLAAGIHAIAPLGSAGVFPYLSDQERESIVAATMDCVAGQVPVMIGVSALTTERTQHHARFAEERGASAVMIIPMSYWKLTEAEIFTHFNTVAETVSLPIMAYNNPATGGLDMAPEFLAKLLQIPNITMVKESAGDVSRFHRLAEITPPDFAFYNGSNPLALDAFMAGAAGWCTAAANLIPQLNLNLYAAIKKGDFEKAFALFQKQLPLLQFVVQGGLPRTIAAGLRILGFDIGPLRAPLAELSETDQARLRDILRSIL